jgi:hypothetical protein
MFQNNNNFTSSHYEASLRDPEEHARKRKIIYDRLWTVHDAYVNDPKERFKASGMDVLIEMNCETGYGPMGDKSPSEDMLVFMRQMLDAFGISPHRYEVEDAAHELLYHLDFQEPYWLLVDSAVTFIKGGNVDKCYRFKDTGRAIEPDSCEVFQVNFGWNFAPFEAAMSMLRHPLAKRVMAGEVVHNPSSGAVITKHGLLDKLVECVWGSRNAFDWIIDQLLQNRYDNEVYYRSDSPYEAEDAQINFDLDYEFFLFSYVAGMLWLRSPQAMQYLIKIHPIYGALLYWDAESQQPRALPNTGNLALVTGWDVYTAEHLLVTNAPAGSCFGCGQSLHCTKFVNINGLRGDPCTCGRGHEDPTNTETGYHDRNCAMLRSMRFEFLCQKCMYDGTYGSSTIKCGRAICPNTKCNWHMGDGARIKALTEKRKLMLTGPSA